MYLVKGSDIELRRGVNFDGFCLYIIVSLFFGVDRVIGF